MKFLIKITLILSVVFLSLVLSDNAAPGTIDKNGYVVYCPCMGKICFCSYFFVIKVNFGNSDRQEEDRKKFITNTIFEVFLKMFWLEERGKLYNLKNV